MTVNFTDSIIMTPFVRHIRSLHGHCTCTIIRGDPEGVVGGGTHTGRGGGTVILGLLC